MPLKIEADPFKFFNFLLKRKEFLSTIKDVWNTSGLVGCNMFRVYYKLKSLKDILLRLNTVHFSKI